MDPKSPAAPPVRRINSETHLAVQLLLAVSDGRVCKAGRVPPSAPYTPPSALSNDMHADTSDDSEATDAAASSLASPDLMSVRPVPSPPSPCAVPIAHTPPTRGDAPLSKYTREERLEALERFREKKRRRQYHKRVRYMVRKRLAETRPRYKGRFAKPPPGENYDDGTPGPPVDKASEKCDVKMKVKQVVRKETATCNE